MFLLIELIFSSLFNIVSYDMHTIIKIDYQYLNVHNYDATVLVWLFVTMVHCLMIEDFSLLILLASEIIYIHMKASSNTC